MDGDGVSEGEGDINGDGDGDSDRNSNSKQAISHYPWPRMIIYSNLILARYLYILLDLSTFISFVCMPLGILNNETITFKLFKKDITVYSL